MVSVEVALPFAVSAAWVGLKLKVVPAGPPVTVHVTVPEKPAMEVAVSVQLRVWVRPMLIEDVLAPTVKSGCACTVSCTVVLRLVEPPGPVMVKVEVPG